MAAAGKTRIAHTGSVFSVEVLSWNDESGRIVERDIVRHPGAVLIVPVLDDQRLVMIRNFRVAAGRELLEFPAGKLERGEEPRAAAARELEEETGYRASRWSPLMEFYTSPGFTDERMHVFVAEQLTPVGQRLEAGEQIRVEVLRVDEALAMIDPGRMEDGKSIAALLTWVRKAAPRSGVPQSRSVAMGGFGGA